MTQLQNAQYALSDALLHLPFGQLEEVKRTLYYALGCVEDARRVYEPEILSKEEQEKKELVEADMTYDAKEQAAEFFAGQNPGESDVL